MPGARAGPARASRCALSTTPVPAAPAGRRVDDLTDLGDRLDQTRRHRPLPRPAAPRRSRAPGRPTLPRAGRRRLAPRRPASRTTTTRRSTRNGGVVQASTTAPISRPSTDDPPCSSTTRLGSRPATRRSISDRASWATSAGSSPRTKYAGAIVSTDVAASVMPPRRPRRARRPPGTCRPRRGPAAPGSRA